MKIIYYYLSFLLHNHHLEACNFVSGGCSSRKMALAFSNERCPLRQCWRRHISVKKWCIRSGQNSLSMIERFWQIYVSWHKIFAHLYTGTYRERCLLHTYLHSGQRQSARHWHCFVNCGWDNRTIKSINLSLECVAQSTALPPMLVELSTWRNRCNRPWLEREKKCSVSLPRLMNALHRKPEMVCGDHGLPTRTPYSPGKEQPSKPTSACIQVRT